MALGGADGAEYSSKCSGLTRKWKYHVFLSFRGEDTRKSFTDHLYNMLQRKGIITFRDDEELERGEVIKQSLLKAIEDSFSAVVVFSENYASSTSCLDELVKILDSRKEVGLHVFPIFYGVDPSHVRHQKGSFAEAFKKHDERFAKDKRKVQRWRNALEEVANLSGWHSENWHETKFIENISEAVCSKLHSKLPPDFDILVGIDSRIEELDSLVAKGLGDVPFIGIWGMGGIGKTTLARVVYERIRGDFDFSCFLANVREACEREGLVQLQRKLLSHTKIRSMEIDDCFEGKKLIKNILCSQKVLLILDDINDVRQLENLAGKQEWFGLGSRVIITTRDMHILTTHGVSVKYEIKILSYDESLQLFYQKAFKGDQPKEGYLELSRSVVEYVKGLPLALNVLGSFLYGRSILEWKEALDKLREVPPTDILKTLKISYDGLEDAEKNIFLDIACFFKGMAKDQVTQILKNCGLYPTIGIQVLIEKSMVYNDKGCLWMHDLLQELGKNIVIQESLNDVGRRSRLWSLEDINYVLEKNKGTEAIQCVVLTLLQPHKSYWDLEAFSKMCNLRLLIISSNLQLPYGLKCFSSSLKVLEWVGCPLDALPIAVQLNELVDLKMKHSKIKQLWKGVQLLGKLKSIDLSNSKDIVKTPNLDGVPNLERLVFEGCENLVEVHHSLGQHKKLVIVNFKYCKSLKTLPSEFDMQSLETLILSGCLKVRKLPDFGKNMECLSTIDLEETSIAKLPQSLAYLTGLVVLNLRNCKNLVCLPNVQNLKSIKTINMFGCLKFSSLPENLNDYEALEELDVSGTAIKEVPSSILHLKNLEVLSFGRCTGQAPPQSWKLPFPFDWVFRLNKPSIPTRLMLPPSLSGLPSLKELDLSFCNLCDGSIPNDFGCLSSLQKLNLSGNNFVNLPASLFSNLLKLDYLYLNTCRKLKFLPGLPLNVSLVYDSECVSLQTSLNSQQLCQFFEYINLQRSWHGYYHTTSLNTPGCEIPPWFQNQNYCSVADIVSEVVESSGLSILADIPNYCRSSEWSGVAICLVLQFDLRSAPSDENYFIYWNSKSPEEEFQDTWSSYEIKKPYDSYYQLFITFVPCDRRKQVQLLFSLSKEGSLGKFQISKCGRRVLCKEDVTNWRSSNNKRRHDESIGEYATSSDVEAQSHAAKRRKLQ